MSSLQYEFFLMVLLLLRIKDSQAFYKAGYEIKDLQETELSLFQKEAENWKISGLASETKITTALIQDAAKPEFILGGLIPSKPWTSPQHHIYFERIYTNLPPHTTVAFTGKIWFSGSWSKESKPTINLRLTSSSIINDAQPDILSKANEQGNAKLDHWSFDYVNAEEQHGESTLYLTIEIIIPADLEEQCFGFREITLHVGDSAKVYGSNHLCYEAQGPSGFENQICPCPSGQTWDIVDCQRCAQNCVNCFGVQPSNCRLCSPETHWQGDKCTICHPGCKSCTGPSQHECSGCNFGFYDYENGTCLQTCQFPFEKGGDQYHLRCYRICKPDKYLFSSTRRCVSKCQFPFIPKIDENGILLCQSPCSDEYKFTYTNGSCASSCPPPLKTEEFYGGKFCTNPCTLKNGYLYLNGSCFDSCPLPFKIKSEPMANYCLNPCPAANLYFYQNGSCLFRCPPPLKAREKFGVKYCQGPCDLAREYILSDGSCSKECLFPLVQRVERLMGTYCMSPCESRDHFLSQNGSCVASCPKFFETRIEHGVKYCLSPCSVGQYFFLRNKTCLDACPYPLLEEKSEAGVSLCENPCSSQNSGAFLYDDQSCSQGCPAPLRIEGGNICKSPCRERNKYVNLDGGCQGNCEYPHKIAKQGPYQICILEMNTDFTLQIGRMKKIIRASNIFSENGGVLSSLINFGDPTSLLMLPLLDMFEEVRETNTTLSMKTQLILNQDDLDESFRVLEIVCVICLLLSVIRVFFRLSSESKIDLLFRMKLNILGPIVVDLNGKAVLYLLEFRWDGSLFRTLACMVVILLTTLVGYKVWDAKRRRDERWRFILEVYKPDKLFLLIYIIRMSLVSFVIGCFQEYPGAQAMLMVLANFGILFFLVYGSPIRKTICYIQHLIIEIGLLFYNVLFMILAVRGHQEDIDIIGDLMNILYVITCIVTAIITVLKLLLYIFCAAETSGGNQTGHIQLREFNQSEIGGDENTEQQVPAEIESWEREQNSDSEGDGDLEAEVLIE